MTFPKPSGFVGQAVVRSQVVLEAAVLEARPSLKSWDVCRSLAVFKWGRGEGAF